MKIEELDRKELEREKRCLEEIHDSLQREWEEADAEEQEMAEKKVEIHAKIRDILEREAAIINALWGKWGGRK